MYYHLNILGLARSRTAKGVLDAGWGQLLQILAYKAEGQPGRAKLVAGRRVVGVDPKHTSQDCPVCGYREKKPFWVREFTCPQCGTLRHRDVAAALNVLAKARVSPQGYLAGACGDGYGVGRPVRTEVTGEARILQPRSSERGVVRVCGC